MNLRSLAGRLPTVMMGHWLQTMEVQKDLRSVADRAEQLAFDVDSLLDGTETDELGKILVPVRDFLRQLAGVPASQKDACEICKGESGGVPGNENLIKVDGKVVKMCDYCHTARLGG